VGEPNPGNNDYFALIQKNLVPRPYRLIACGDEYPSVESIRAFEKDLGVSLPDDFVDFSVSRIGGLYIEVKEEFWPPPKRFEVRPFWAMLSGLWVYGFADEAPEFMNILDQTPKVRERTGLELTPCLKIIGDANIYAFTQEGALVRWDHETGEAEPVSGSFLDTLDWELGELAKRQVRMEDERESFLRRE